MERSRLRGVVTLLLAAALLVWLAAPLSAAPSARVGVRAAGTAEVRTVPDLADALVAWLANLWSSVRPGGGPTAIAEGLGVDIDPDDSPTVTPQIGLVIDPDG